MIDITTVNNPFTLEAEIPLPAPIKVNRSYLWIVVILIILAGVIIYCYLKSKEDNVNQKQYVL